MLTTPEDMPTNKAQDADASALAAANTTIASLQAKSQQQAHNLNHAYQIQENTTYKAGVGRGGGPGFDGGCGLQQLWGPL